MPIARWFWCGVLDIDLTPRAEDAGSGWETDTNGLRLGIHERGPAPGAPPPLPYFPLPARPTPLGGGPGLAGAFSPPGGGGPFCGAWGARLFSWAARRPPASQPRRIRERSA